MPEINHEVMDQVREILQRQPDATSRELFDLAQRMDPSLAELSLRQFHGRYVLSAHRALRKNASPGEPARPRATRRSSARAKDKGKGKRASGAKEQPAERKAAAKGAPRRDAIRAVLVQFARDFSEAESRSEIVGVLTDLDRYVDQVEAALR